MPANRRIAVTIALGTLALGACSSNSSDDGGTKMPDVVASSPSSSASASTPTSAPSSSSATASPSATSPSASASSASASSSGTPSMSAAAAQHFTGTEWNRFTSPSGKNECELEPGIVTCRLSPAVSAANGGNNLISLNAHGWAVTSGDQGLAVGDEGNAWASSGTGPMPGLVNGTRVLPYGSTISSGDVTCSSSTAGFSCSNSVAGFAVNSQRVTGHGTPNDTLAADD